MRYDRPFQTGIENEFNAFQKKQKNRFPENETLTIDLHCHDYNSNVPDELLGRLLNVPETWLPSEELLKTLTDHGCDTFTVTNHNNARSCYEMREKGTDILTGAEFTCYVPDYKTSIHVLTYGFTPNQEKDLSGLRSDIYKFQNYTREHDIPTIWAHPLYHHSKKGLPLEFFDKMALVFERFEVINGQRDTWQNMLVKLWVEGLMEERINQLAKSTGIEPDRYCRNPYKKSMAGGSDSHMGIYAGLTATRLHVPDLEEKLKIMSRSMLALEAIKKGKMAPVGSINEGEKMAVAFLDYFCQIAMYMEDPGLLRILLHKGSSREKAVGFIIANLFSELKQHRVTMNFLKLFHQCLTGNVPGTSKKFFIRKHYKPIFNTAQEMALVKRDNPEEVTEVFKKSIDFIYNELSALFYKRLRKKIDEVFEKHMGETDDPQSFVESLELPSTIRKYLGVSRQKSNGGGLSEKVTEFLDGLSFPFLTSAVVLGANFASTKVLYNSRELLEKFSRQTGALEHPRRMLWVTDTFEDTNGVAMVLRSMLEEIRKRDLPIDILVCSSRLKSEDHLIIVPPDFEFTFPFYEQQPLRVPNLLEIHRTFRDREYDRIICSTEGPMGLVSLYLKHAYSVPAYFYVHTDWIMFARKVLDFDSQNLNRLRRMIRALYREFDGLFVLNTDQKKWLTGREMGFNPKSVFQTAHWVEEKFKPKKSKRSKLFGVKENERVLLFIGRISNEKGVNEIPEIYRKIRNDYPDVRVVFAGSGPAEKELKKEFPEGIFLGWVDHDMLPEIYSAADLLLLPSKFDTFGVVVLEAMSCGLPVIAYRTKGPKDIIQHNRNGYLVKTRSEMVTYVRSYLKSRDRQKKFKERVLERAREYNADTIIQKMMKEIDLPVEI